MGKKNLPAKLDENSPVESNEKSGRSTNIDASDFPDFVYDEENLCFWCGGSGMEELPSRMIRSCGKCKGTGKNPKSEWRKPYIKANLKGDVWWE